MDYNVKASIKTNYDTLARAANRDDIAITGLHDGWIEGPEYERIENAHRGQPLVLDSRRQRFDVNGYVGQLRHR
jgi:hypothetical protein